MTLEALVREAGQSLSGALALFGPSPQSDGWSTGLGDGRDAVTQAGAEAAQNWAGAGGSAYVATSSGQTRALDSTINVDQGVAAGAAQAAQGAADGRSGMNGIIGDTRAGVAAIAPATNTAGGQQALVTHLQSQLRRAEALLKHSERNNIAIANAIRQRAGGYQMPMPAMGGGSPAGGSASTGGMPSPTTPHRRGAHQARLTSAAHPVSPVTSGGAVNPSDKRSVARYIYNAALARGYSPDEALAITAYSVGESGLEPTISGGVQGDDEVKGLFQEKTDFARAGGVDPSLRGTVEGNVEAYLNQLERNRHLPMAAFGVGNGALATTSVGGPLSSAGAQDWGTLVARARQYLGIGVV